METEDTGCEENENPTQRTQAAIGRGRTETSLDRFRQVLGNGEGSDDAATPVPEKRHQQEQCQE